MNKILRSFLTFFLNMASLALMVVAILPASALFRFVLHTDFPKLIKQDYSGIWAYQTMLLCPIGIGVASVCLIWAAILYVFKRRIWAGIFIVFLVFNLLITFIGLPVATIFYTKKDISHKTIAEVKSDIMRKKEDARKKLKEISKLDLFEQKNILTTLNSPQDNSLIPEWEAFGKRVVNFVPDDKMAANRHYLLDDAIEALMQYYDNPEALVAIKSIEKELRNTTTPKEKILFSKIFMGIQNAANPPYQILTEENIAKQAEARQIYLEAERGFEGLRLSGNLVKEGEYLVKLRLYKDALARYRQALNAPYVDSESDAMAAGRGFADALILAGISNNLEDLKTAIYWQKRVLKKGIGIQWINKEIIKLWILYDSYSDLCHRENLPIDPNVIEWKFKIDGEYKRKELEKKFGRFEDKSDLFWDLGDYYYRSLNFDLAEQTLLDGIKYTKEWEASGKPIKHDIHMDEGMFHDLLKDLYVIMGKYDEAIKQVEEFKSLIAKKPKDRYYSKSYNIILNEKLDHYILALKYARDHKISPRDLKYSNSFEYFFIDFDEPEWVTWDQKYKELLPRVKNMR